MAVNAKLGAFGESSASVHRRDSLAQFLKEKTLEFILEH